ncbi:MAG: hypothetical protein KAU27_09175 [Desulfuromonadales bacterium]|jgi:hypothetical protein|nr:hypothetical protein [Desulfuromonadales bacterium]
MNGGWISEIESLRNLTGVFADRNEADRLSRLGSNMTQMLYNVIRQNVLIFHGRPVMINLKLNNAEKQILDEILATSLNRLGDEISHTDSRDYRDVLKERKEVLLKIKEKLH